MPSYPQGAFFIARVVTAIVLIAHGLDKWGDTLATIERFQAFGFSPLVAYVTSLVEIIAGFMLLVGLFVRLSAALLGATMLGAVLVQGANGLIGGMELPLALFGLCLIVFVAGSTKWALYPTFRGQ